jgi:hypothetical protein
MGVISAPTDKVIHRQMIATLLLLVAAASATDFSGAQVDVYRAYCPDNITTVISSSSACTQAGLTGDYFSGVTLSATPQTSSFYGSQTGPGLTSITITSTDVILTCQAGQANANATHLKSGETLYIIISVVAGRRWVREAPPLTVLHTGASFASITK